MVSIEKIVLLANARALPSYLYVSPTRYYSVIFEASSVDMIHQKAGIVSLVKEGYLILYRDYDCTLWL